MHAKPNSSLATAQAKDRHMHRCRNGVQEPPEPRRAAMAQYGTVAKRQHRCHPSALDRNSSMADRKDTAVQCV